MMHPESVRLMVVLDWKIPIVFMEETDDPFLCRFNLFLFKFDLILFEDILRPNGFVFIVLLRENNANREDFASVPQDLSCPPRRKMNFAVQPRYVIHRV